MVTSSMCRLNPSHVKNHNLNWKMIVKYVTKIFVIEALSRTKTDDWSYITFSPTPKVIKGLGYMEPVLDRFKKKTLLFMSIVYILQFIDFLCKVCLCGSK